jgi:hypothetical protein
MPGSGADTGQDTAGIGLAVYRLLALGMKAEATETGLYILVFGIGCAFAAALILVVDICIFVIRGWSFLKLEHSFIRSLLVFALLPAAAGIVGMLGLALDVLQGSRAACVVVGIAWPSVLTALIGAIQPEHDDDTAPEEGEEPIE